jgi:hypothetical protein
MPTPRRLTRIHKLKAVADCPWLSYSHRYYDPKEDAPTFGLANAGNGKKFAPNSVDGVNLIHSWNKVGLDAVTAIAAYNRPAPCPSHR